MEINENEFYEEDDMVVTLELEDGTEEECIVLNIFEVDGRQYVALLPSKDADKEDADVYFYTYEEGKDGEPILGDIEDDDVFEAVCDRFDEILDETDFEAQEEEQEEK